MTTYCFSLVANRRMQEEPSLHAIQMQEKLQAMQQIKDHTSFRVRTQLK